MRKYYYIKVQLIYHDGEFFEAYVGHYYKGGIYLFVDKLITEASKAEHELRKLEKLAKQIASRDINQFNESITYLTLDYFKAV